MSHPSPLVTSGFTRKYLTEVMGILRGLDMSAIEALVERLRSVRERGGRVFVLGVGGSAANASHCVNDLRVRAGIEAYAPTDNVAEVTARVNDEVTGEVSYLGSWLRGSRLTSADAVLGLSGSGESQVLTHAMLCADDAKAMTLAIVGTAGSWLHEHADHAVVIPCPVPAHRAGHAEAFQAIVWHLCVAHPGLALDRVDGTPLG